MLTYEAGLIQLMSFFNLSNLLAFCGPLKKLAFFGTCRGQSIVIFDNS